MQTDNTDTQKEMLEILKKILAAIEAPAKLAEQKKIEDEAQAAKTQAEYREALHKNRPRSFSG